MALSWPGSPNSSLLLKYMVAIFHWRTAIYKSRVCSVITRVTPEVLFTLKTWSFGSDHLSSGLTALSPQQIKFGGWGSSLGSSLAISTSWVLSLMCLTNFFGVEKLGGNQLHCMAVWVQTEVGGGIPQSLLVPCCYRKPEGSKEQEREVVPLFRITDLWWPCLGFQIGCLLLHCSDCRCWAPPSRWGISAQY